MNSILLSEKVQEMVSRYGHQLVTESISNILQRLREGILAGQDWQPDLAAIEKELAVLLENCCSPRLRKVINCSGIILHTNLGRAVLSERARQAVQNAAEAYTNLEYDLKTGRRGSRQSLVEDLLIRLSGAESSLVVNNNAAAVLLVMNTLAAGREVIVSRGELVEIGGSFRIPEVLKLGGTRLIEVGTTNRTHLEDYEKAVSSNTALLLKVHTSNFRIVGFSKSVDRQALKKLAALHNLPLVEDLGSGSLLDLTSWGLPEEPPVKTVISQGVDVVTFSGDKLLGGPQAGIIAGKKALLDQMRSNQLYRALRPDKLTLAALEATLWEYLQPEGVMKELPIYRMFSRSISELTAAAERIAGNLRELNGIMSCDVIETKGAMGAGSLPVQSLPSRGVALKPKTLSLQQAETAMRSLPVPIIGYITEDTIVLDMRTLLPGDEELLLDGLKTIFGG